MKRFPKILAATCAAIALSSSLALAAEAPKKAAPAPAHAAGHAMHAQGGMMGHMGALAQLSPEKQEAARKLMDEHRKAQFTLHQALYAKNAELEALNAAGNGDSAKAKTVIRDIADLQAKMLTANGAFRARLFKETGISTPVMGHGMMGGGMGGGMGGMMGGKGMGCGMMQGGMQHGAPAAQNAPAPAAAPAAPAASAHDAHKN